MTIGAKTTYLDYNASAPLRPQARTVLLEALECEGNASSIHAFGRKASGVIEAARKDIAALVDALPANVAFTSGGTEANVTALSPIWLRNGQPFTLSKLFVSAVEHPSVLAGGRFSAEQVEQLPVDANGLLNLEILREKLGALPEGETALVAVMAANSETGVLQPLQEIGVIVEDAGHLLHVDAVQAAGRIALSQPMIASHSMAVSSHKIGGPQGVGALIMGKGDLRPAPLLTGGGQESWRRAGTHNTAGIAAFAAAARAALAEIPSLETQALRDQLEQELRLEQPDLVVFGADAPRLPGTTCLTVPGVVAETALIAFDLAGIAVSSGSACSSGKVGASHVLLAMGCEEDLARGALRISMGWNTSADEMQKFKREFLRIAARLQKKDRARAAS